MKLKHWQFWQIGFYPHDIPSDKDFGYHKDQYCFVLKAPHPGSHIGSGKVSRRVYLDYRGIKPPKNGKSKSARRRRVAEQQQLLLSQAQKRKEQPKGPFSFGNSQNKLILQRWNTFGHPFVKHLPKKSATTSRIKSLLSKITKKHETARIIGACEVGHKLFDSKNFVFGWFYDKSKIGLDAFLEIPTGKRGAFVQLDAIKRVRKQFGIDIPKSWFNECLKGWQYVEKEYCRETGIKDEYPEMTAQAIEMMERHRLRPINDKGKQDIVRFVRMMFNYCEVNKMDPLWLFDRINDALNSFHTMKIDKTHYLTTDIFWSDTLPNELIRFDKGGFQDRELISDREKLIK